MFFVGFSSRTETNARRARSASHVRGEKRKTVFLACDLRFKLALLFRVQLTKAKKGYACCEGHVGEYSFPRKING